jgi:hypothetical protein
MKPQGRYMYMPSVGTCGRSLVIVLCLKSNNCLSLAAAEATFRQTSLCILSPLSTASSNTHLPTSLTVLYISASLLYWPPPYHSLFQRGTNRPLPLSLLHAQCCPRSFLVGLAAVYTVSPLFAFWSSQPSMGVIIPLQHQAHLHC